VGRGWGGERGRSEAALLRGRQGVGQLAVSAPVRHSLSAPAHREKLLSCAPVRRSPWSQPLLRHVGVCALLLRCAAARLDAELGDAAALTAAALTPAPGRASANAVRSCLPTPSGRAEVRLLDWDACPPRAGAAAARRCQGACERGAPRRHGPPHRRAAPPAHGQACAAAPDWAAQFAAKRSRMTSTLTAPSCSSCSDALFRQHAGADDARRTPLQHADSAQRSELSLVVRAECCAVAADAACRRKSCACLT
jgi:hypothetical protein